MAPLSTRWSAAGLTVAFVLLGTTAVLAWLLVIRAIWNHTFALPAGASVNVGALVAALLFVGIVASFLTAGAYQALYEARRRRDPSTVASWRRPLDLKSWVREHPILTALLLAWIAITVLAVSLD